MFESNISLSSCQNNACFKEEYQLFIFQLFKGTFYYCKGPNVRLVKNKTQCLEGKRNIWVNQKYNFDSLGQVSIMFTYILTNLGRTDFPIFII